MITTQKSKAIPLHQDKFCKAITLQREFDKLKEQGFNPVVMFNPKSKNTFVSLFSESVYKDCVKVEPLPSIPRRN